MGTADLRQDEGAAPGRPVTPGDSADPAAAAVAPGAGGEFCPNCEMPLEEGAVLCTQCGYDLQRGTLLADGAKPVAPEAPPVATAWQTLLDFFPGLYYPGIMVLALFCTGLAGFLAVFTMIVFAMGAYLSAGAIGVATLATWTQAVTLMCVGRAEFFNTALGDIEGTQFGVFMGLVLAPPFALWVLLGWISSTHGG